ncbi:uncharacterized protein MELLADRAFT_69036 [Melampsora larici-populina 98AG31]|uniref:Uncharacterized protein n=1 Tax=Melampsora larici-populina (strain 98AG31 / pathotype 3-4-7) TaxID=747676 RepID=F4S965_MELLP|nr:uncharacterized protein MELLADRAFT_69036 [Melampsora larici-populina 98AG31]EGF98816.1 hypothetical protein MELLADRAFT_69036 [Melampsora larici-populina 98AG31]
MPRLLIKRLTPPILAFLPARPDHWITTLLQLHLSFDANHTGTASCSEERKKMGEFDLLILRPKSRKLQTSMLDGASHNQLTPSKPTSNPVGPQALDNSNTCIPPLIDLSETNWMDTPNPVQQLEESVENLRLKMEMNEKSDLTVLADEMRRDKEDLKQKVDHMGTLHATLTDLKGEVSRLCKNLAAAVEDIQAHEEVIASLINMQESDESRSVESSSSMISHI